MLGHTISNIPPPSALRHLPTPECHKPRAPYANEAYDANRSSESDPPEHASMLATNVRSSLPFTRAATDAYAATVAAARLVAFPPDDDATAGGISTDATGTPPPARALIVDTSSAIANGSM
jgi:hypothetical protein